MVTAAIKINGSSGSQDNLSVGVAATLTNTDNTGVTSWLWQLLSKPPGSTVSIVNPMNATASLTPDVVGSYLIKLTVSDGVDSDDDQVIGAVKTQYLDMRVPAAGETTEFNGTNGWAEGIYNALIAIDPLGAHAIAGTYHTSSTLAQLNAKISDANLDDSTASRPPTGTATGDLSGTYPSPTVAKLRNRNVSSAVPTDGYALVWNAGLSQWEPGVVASTGNTLDQAYDEGGAGAGRQINVDSGPVLLDVSGGDSGLRLQATGDLGGSPILEVDVISDENSQSNAWIRLIADGYYEVVNIVSDLWSSIPAGGSYTAVGIQSDLRPFPWNPASTTTIAFKADVHGLDTPREGVYVAYDVQNSGFPNVSFDFALRASAGSILLQDGDIHLLDGYISLAEKSSDPAVESNTGFVYTKDDSGRTELFYFDANGNAVQITKDGAVNAAGGGAGTLQQAYNGGRIIGISYGPVEIDAYGDEALNVDGYIGLAAISTPTPLGEKGLLYVREVSSVNQLFYMDSDGIAYQLSAQGQGLQSVVDSSLIGIPGIPTGSFPQPPLLNVSLTVTEGEDVLVTFAGSADPALTANPFENVYVRLAVDTVPVFTNRVSVLPVITGLEATDISFSFLLTNLAAGLRTITISIDTGTAPGDPAGTVGINTPVLGAARVLSAGSVNLQMAYQNGRFMYLEDPIVIDAYGNEAFNIDGYIGFEPITTPTKLSNKGLSYTSRIDGYAELFYLDNYGKASQITSKGSLNVVPVTLDQAYDGSGGSGSGRIIDVDSGPVLLYVSGDDSGLSLESAGNLDGNPILTTEIYSESNGQIGVWHQLNTDGYYEPRSVISDMNVGLPAGGSYTAVGIQSDIRPYPSNPADTTISAFQAGVHGLDIPREGLFIAYDARSINAPLVQFQYALYADAGSVGLDSGDLILRDGYIYLGEQLSDPAPNDDTGFVYAKDVDGYTELFFMDNYGSITQITDDGYLAGTSKSAQDSLDSTGTETYMDLTFTPLLTPDTDSGRDLQVYRNGILMRWIVSLGADPNRWTYNPSLNRVEFVASGGVDWYTAIYNRR